jgi:hypothetical protein
MRTKRSWKAIGESKTKDISLVSAFMHRPGIEPGAGRIIEM